MNEALYSRDHAEQERTGEERMCDLRHHSLEARIDELQKTCEMRWTTEEKAMIARWAGLERRFETNDKRVYEAKLVADKAIDKAEALATHRAMQQNEWRATITEIMTSMVPRTEYAVQHQILAEKAETNAKNIDREMSGMRERANSSRIQTLILTGLMTAVFTMLVYLVFIHIR